MRNLLLIIVLIFVCAADARATVVMDWASIGYAGNAGDPALGLPNSPITFGAVNYNYQISKYDVTNNQYVEFLNDKDPTGANTLQLYTAPTQGLAGIAFDSAAASGDKYSIVAGRGTMPVNYVSQWSAERFANWLNNGQGNADTESGAYTLLGGVFPTNNLAIVRSPNAHIVLPTENEWYKAAYYNPVNATYFAYPGSNTPPTAGPPPGTPNSANWNSNPQGADLTPVGAYSTTMSSFGTFDQFGDVVQWLDPTNGGLLRGVSFYLGNALGPQADIPQSQLWQTAGFYAYQIENFIGFRVAMIVPEPSSVALAALGFAGLAAWSWRRKRSRIAALVLLAALAAFADDARAVTIAWSPVGNPGNVRDTAFPIYPGGAVAYNYSIGTYDVTFNQYAEFLNAKDPSGANSLGLYHTEMDNLAWCGISYNSGNLTGSKYVVLANQGNYPVSDVNWYDLAADSLCHSAYDSCDWLPSPFAARCWR